MTIARTTALYTYIRSLSLLLLALALFFPSKLNATAIIVPLLKEPVTISQNPPVKIIAQGPYSISFYRVTLEVENRNTSDSLFLRVNEQSLSVFADESGRAIKNPSPTIDSNIWLTYDDNKQRFPLRRMKIAWSQGADAEEVDYQVVSTFEKEIEIPALGATAIDLDFELPTDLPSLASLYIAELNLGAGDPITIRVAKEFTQAERVFLNQNRKIASRRVELMKMEKEAKASGGNQQSENDQ